MSECGDKSRYWFPAKQYGWGWGVPSRWPGFVVLAAYVVLTVINASIYPPALHPLAFFTGNAVLMIALFVVCLVKGEPPAWRWGKS